MRRINGLRLVIALSCGLAGTAVAAPVPSCPSSTITRTQLRALSALGWQVNPGSADRLALMITECLRSPDPELRDQLAFTGLQTWMRGGKLSNAAMVAMAANLEAQLKYPDPFGVGRPFAALTLAEVARADRKAHFLTASQRASINRAAVEYLPGVRDYRGFDDFVGWRHGVAHGADLILQLTLNPQTGKDDLARMRDAIGMQVAPSTHAYVFAEPQRLALPIIYMAQRNEFTHDDWASWLERIASPAPLSSWGQAFGRSADLKRLHNLRAFVTELYVAARLDGDQRDDMLIAPLEKILIKLP